MGNVKMKFRCWDKGFNCFVRSDYVPNPLVDNGCQFYTVSFGNKDICGKEIYEGDIVKVPWGWSGDTHVNEGVSIVTFDGAGLGFDGPMDAAFRDIEIIGNIFENPTMYDLYVAQEELDKEFPTKELK